MQCLFSLHPTTIIHCYCTRQMPSSLSSCFATSARIHVMALDGIINVNSLFTVALFLGLATLPNPKNQDNNSSSCSAGLAVARDLVAYHVYSFSSFLFSSLIALALKLAITFTEKESASTDAGDEDMLGSGAMLGHINVAVLRVGILTSAAGSFSGSGFLMMAIFDLVQIKLGFLGCGDSRHMLAAIVPLLVLVPSSLLAYLGLAIYAFRR